MHFLQETEMFPRAKKLDSAKILSVVARSCFGDSFCRSCPIETRHYSLTVNSCFLHGYYPFGCCPYIGILLLKSDLLYRLPFDESSIYTCGSADLFMTRRKSHQ